LLAVIKKATAILKTQGIKSSLNKLLWRIDCKSLNGCHKISEEERQKQEKVNLEYMPLISIVVPLYNTDEAFLREMLLSVQAQTYKNWELCLCDGSDEKHAYVEKTVRSFNDLRIRYKRLEGNSGISENTNECLRLASGEYISLLDHDDYLHPSALFETVREINNGADFVYSDEATFTGDMNIIRAHFKPDFAPYTLRSYNYICHFTTFKRALLEKTGGFRKCCDGSQDYDLFLRLTENAEHIAHIPKILYFWRGHESSTASDISAKPYITEAARRALSEQLARKNIQGTVLDAGIPSNYRIAYGVPDKPRVNILVFGGSTDVIPSIYESSNYGNYSVTVIGKINEEIARRYQGVDFVEGDINSIIKASQGEYILFVNGNTVFDNGFVIDELLGMCVQGDVGAVGGLICSNKGRVMHAGIILGINKTFGYAFNGFSRFANGYMSRLQIQQNASAVSFNLCMAKKSVLEECGLFDLTFTEEYRDVAMCIKMQKSGYNICFTPFASVTANKKIINKLRLDEVRFSQCFGELKDVYYNESLTLQNEDFRMKKRGK